MILGLDIGGANTKAASSDGSIAESIYLPLWRNAPLLETLKRIAHAGPDALGVVMTGELADCYGNKLEGIESIKAAVEEAFSCPISFWGVNGFSWKNPMDLAAANWSASSALVLKDIGDCLFVDMGSTTTDLIPLKGRPLAGITDFQRLSRGELVYMGMLRTSVGALLHSAHIDGKSVPLSPELFAITADAYLALGKISPEQYACDTPDGSDKSREASMRRLARTVCADLEEIGEPGASIIAEQVLDRQRKVLMNAIQKQCRVHGLNRVVAAGIGKDIISQASESLGLSCLRLSELYGKRISDIFPAYAVARLLEMETKSISRV